MSKPTMRVTEDFTNKFNEVILKLKKDKVLVGVPEAKNSRKDEESTEENNASLLALCTYGSAMENIPPWPVMTIGILDVNNEIADQFKFAAVKSLEQGTNAADTYYNRAGIIASTSIKKVINEQEDVPEGRPRPMTLALRKARGFKGTKYWLVTGQLRNSITYVIEEYKK